MQDYRIETTMCLCMTWLTKVYKHVLMYPSSSCCVHALLVIETWKLRFRSIIIVVSAHLINNPRMYRRIWPSSYDVLTRVQGFFMLPITLTFSTSSSHFWEGSRVKSKYNEQTYLFSIVLPTSSKCHRRTNKGNVQ